jgi:DNA processing protein
MTTPSDRISWLRLARSENVGKSTFFRLIDICGSVSKALDYVADLSNSGKISKKIKICSQSNAQREFELTTKFGAEILLFEDEKYPRLLRSIPDPAPILTIKGDVELFKQDCVAVVGSRNASFNGISFAKKVALELGQVSITTVSGMARGIDTAVHEASILSGTIAVIAGGINNIYPQENAALYGEVMQRGIVMSEMPFDAPPKGGNFVQRNRLISGLSLAVVVVEAGLKSGSLVTARFAAEQGREVFAVPGSPFDPRCHGANRLIKDGANMLEKIDDVLNEIPNLRARFSDVGKLREAEHKPFRGPELKMPNDTEIAKISKEIGEKLSFTATPIDDIIEELQLPARLANIALVELELADKVEVHCGKVTLKS